MKFSPWIISAFVSSGKSNDQLKKSTTSKLVALELFPSLPSNVDYYTYSNNDVPAIVFDMNEHSTSTTQQPSSSSSSLQLVTRKSVLNDGIQSWIQDNIMVPPANAAAETSAPPPPTKDEIKLLREAFAAFYGVDRDSTLAESLLSQAIEAWQRQPPDEQAGLYRVRGDVYMVSAVQ